MSRPMVENLELSWHDNLNGNTIEALRDMADNLPFEKKRSSTLSLDRGQQASRAYSIEHENRFYLIAKFGQERVGSLAVSQFHPEDNKTPLIILEHELVQRNRDDIRHRLLETLGNRFESSRVQIGYPAQNRTARQFIRHTELVNLTNRTNTVFGHLGINNDLFNVEEQSHNDRDLFSDKKNEEDPVKISHPRIDFLQHNSVSVEFDRLAHHFSNYQENTRSTNDSQDELTIQFQELSTSSNERSCLIDRLNYNGGTRHPRKQLHQLQSWARDAGIDHLEYPVLNWNDELNQTSNPNPEIINKRTYFEFEIG